LVALAALAVGQLTGLDLALGVLSLVGAVFLTWLAWDTWRISELHVSLSDEKPGTLAKSIGVNLLNPHPYIFWFTVGGPMVVQAWNSGTLSLVAFLGGFFTCLVGAKMSMALLIGRFRQGFQGRTYAWTMRGLALMLLGFAGWMVMEGLARL
jgi:threonine/homoserine/homoserine lactone efflux protein